MTDEERERAELAVARRVVEALVAADLELQVHDGEEEVLALGRWPADHVLSVLRSTDADTIHTVRGGRHGSFVTFVWGCGWDVVHDSGASLDEVLAPVMAWVEEQAG